MDTQHPVPGVLDNPASKGYEGGFGVALIKKDLNLAIEAANGGKANSEMTAFARDYFQHLEDKGMGNKDFSYVYQYIHKNKKI